MEVDITPVRTRKQKRLFIRLPYRFYRDYPNWVPPLLVEQKGILDTSRHPFYEHAEIEMFLAKTGGDIVGRIAAIEDRNYFECHGEQVGYFGFFECNLNGGPEAAREITNALINAARDWFRARGIDSMIGPMNPSTNYECGMLIEGFDEPPVIMMPYNPPEYPTLMDEAGLEKGRDLISYNYDSEGLPDKARRVADICTRRGYTIRPVNMKKIDEEIEGIYRLYNSAWENNWGFTPMSRNEFHHMGRQLKQIAIPDIIIVAEYKGEVVGFSLALPDINQVLHKMNGRLLPFGFIRLLFGMKRIDRARSLVMGVLEGHRRKGVDALMTLRSRENAARININKADFGWILEDNEVTNNLMLAFGSHPYKKYRIYRDTF